MSLLDKQNQLLYNQTGKSASMVENGMNLFKNALLGVNWGKEG